MAQLLSSDFKEVKAFFDKFSELSKKNEEIRSALIEISEHNKAMLQHSRAIDKLIGKYFPDRAYSGILDKRVKDLPLLNRTKNCLANGDILKVEQLVCLKENDLRRFKNLGEKSLIDVKGRLAELGLSLGMSSMDIEAMKQESE